MPNQFKYQALTTDGRSRTGVVTAQDREQVVEMLDKLHLMPIQVKPARERTTMTLFGFLKRSEFENLIMFTSGLATMYRAGIPILRALSLIRVGRSDSRFNQIISELRVAVESGKSLSEAMTGYPDLFSNIYISSISAGEESGKLDATLDELAAMLETEMNLTRQIKSAVRYPLIVIAILIAAVVVLMSFVIPRFVDFYDSFGASLPLPTRVIIGISGLFTTYWPVAILLLVGMGFGISRLLATPEGRRWYDRTLLKLPVFGELIVKGNIARFSMMFRTMFAAGIPIVRSLEILSGTVRNSVLAEEIIQMEDSFRKGRSLEGFTDKSEWFPPQAVHMMSIGMESGNLERMLRELADHYTKQVMYTSRNLTAIIEPILTVVLGLFVLILALAIFLPMWSLIQVFRGGA